MTTATVRITTSTREQLRELAEQTGKSMQALMGEAVAAYRRRLPGKSHPPATSPVDERRRRLTRYATWDEEDLTEFKEALAAQRTIDDELWR
jgi:hypothetical protein